MDTKPVRQSSLAQQVLEILSERIESGEYSSYSQLPAESALVEELEVSRATVRRALDILEINGKVIRRHGVGSFVSAANKIVNPINESILFQTLIENSGYFPGVIYTKQKLTVPELSVAQKLNLKENEAVVELHKIFTADGEKVIYLINSIPVWAIGEYQDYVISDPKLTEPIFDFLEKKCKQKLIYYISSIRVDVMGNCPCEFEDRVGSESALVFDEIGYNQNDLPIMHSIHYYPGNKMKFEIVRRRTY